MAHALHPQLQKKTLENIYRVNKSRSLKQILEAKLRTQEQRMHDIKVREEMRQEEIALARKMQTREKDRQLRESRREAQTSREIVVFLSYRSRVGVKRLSKGREARAPSFRQPEGKHSVCCAGVGNCRAAASSHLQRSTLEKQSAAQSMNRRRKVLKEGNSSMSCSIGRLSLKIILRPSRICLKPCFTLHYGSVRRDWLRLIRSHSISQVFLAVLLLKFPPRLQKRWKIWSMSWWFRQWDRRNSVPKSKKL